jgi:hypothetical protein
MDYDLVSFIHEAQEHLVLLTPAPEPQPIKGKCRHCGKPVARGIWMHEKHCKEAKP